MKSNNVQPTTHTICSTGSFTYLSESKIQHLEVFGNGFTGLELIKVLNYVFALGNIAAVNSNYPLKQFVYKNKGSLQRLVKKKAVEVINKLKLFGFLTWLFGISYI